MQIRQLPNRIRRIRTAIRLIALLSVATGCAYTRPPIPDVSPHLRLPRSPDTVVYNRTTSRAGRDTSAGTRTVVSRVLTRSGGKVLEVEQVFPGGGGTIVDTAVAELGSLRALSHASHQPSKTMLFVFDGSGATGTVASPPTAEPERVQQSLGGPIFDSNVIDLVISALPLAPGYRTELPFFIYERGGRVPMPVEVKERTIVDFPSLGKRDAWIVSVGVPGAPATIWVDAKTRAVLRTRYDVASQNLSFTDDRVTPIRGDASLD